MLSQIGYMICLANTMNERNVLHWFLIKGKSVTCSVLEAEIYRIAHEFDIEAVIKITL